MQLPSGNSYRKGDGVVQDYEQAISWYRKAAEQGDAYGQALLGQMYAAGLGVEQSDSQAYTWFTSSVVNGLAKVAGLRDATAKKLSPSRLQASQELAGHYFKQYQSQ